MKSETYKQREQEMIEIISEFENKTKEDLSKYYISTLRNTFKDNKIDFAKIYSINTAFVFKKFLKNGELEDLINEAMDIKIK